MRPTFRIGYSPDFAEVSKYLDMVRAAKLDGLPWVECVPLPRLDKLVCTPESLKDFDALFALAPWVKPESLAGVERLAIVARWGVGYDRINVPALTESDIVLTITPEGVKTPVAEAIFTFLFALIKNLPMKDRMVRQGYWRGDLPATGICIRGRTLGSVGCGNIGREMFRMAQSMGFGRFLAYDPFVPPDQVKSLGVEMVSLDTVFRESDFVAVNTLLSEQTLGMIGEAQFRLMKPEAYFINTARGPIVQHDALVRALQEKWIAGAGIDVFPVEPTTKDEPLFALDNVIVAPHAMAWTDETMRDNGMEAADAVLAVARGEVPKGAVNREVLDRPGFRTKLERYRSQ